MIHPKDKFITPEEYLALEEKADHRSEYCDGEIFAMAGGSVNHNQITANIYAGLRQLMAQRPCRVFINDMRLRIQHSGLYTYPDAMVVCGKVEFVLKRDDTVMNPIVIVEVWSDSTQAYDRGAKFALYRRIPALQEYVMIDQNQPYVEHFRREGHFWVLETLEQMDAVLTMPALSCEMPLSVMYERVEWPSEEQARVER
ncbi:MAG: Uma2 family endonuclease [Chloroflexi bacterium]|nr:Uma2 family endonuclease [Chloroflexota bacterium]